MKTTPELIEECITLNAAVAAMSPREQAFVRIGVILGIAATTADLTENVNRKTAPPDLLVWMRGLLHTSPRPDSVNIPE